ncbi:hypothetical protein J6590_055441 [Homalodisca vitripennis]|nr:hypothetical protein J6590_055441 [Homalodisca vitripennis]
MHHVLASVDTATAAAITGLPPDYIMQASPGSFKVIIPRQHNANTGLARVSSAFVHRQQQPQIRSLDEMPLSLARN